MYVERVAQLQKALASLQSASDRREQTERKLRLQLERELRNERARATGSAGGEDSGSGKFQYTRIVFNYEKCSQGDVAAKARGMDVSSHTA